MQIAPRVAIDFGSRHIRATATNTDQIFSCRTELIRSAVSGEVIAVGDDAAAYTLQAGQERIVPVEAGSITDYQGAVALLEHVLANVLSWWHILKPQVVMAESCQLSPAVSQVTGEALQAAGGGTVYMVSTPVLAALGAGIDSTDSSSNLVLDIGAGTTEAGVITRGSSVTKSAVSVGGGDIIAAVCEYINEVHDVEIPQTVVEEMLREIGTALQRDTDQSYTCYAPEKDGNDTKEITVYANQLTAPITKPLQEVVDLVGAIIKETPTTLLSDVAENGIHITGGVANIEHIDTYLKRQLSLPVQAVETPERAVIRGGREALDFISVYKQSVPQE